MGRIEMKDLLDDHMGIETVLDNHTIDLFEIEWINTLNRKLVARFTKDGQTTFANRVGQKMNSTCSIEHF